MWTAFPAVCMKCKTESELAYMATAKAVAKCVAKDVPYFIAWWRGNLAVAVAVAANLETAFHFDVFLTATPLKATLPWIGRVGLWKAFVTICYQMHMVGI